jgi:ActR/RegA family two-component response regulator
LGRRFGFEVYAWVLGSDVIGPAATASDAERMAAERKPHVAIVDINLRHGERSYALIDRLCGQGVRVVVVTGYEDAALPKGSAADILQKPVNADVLFTTLLPWVPIGNGKE